VILLAGDIELDDALIGRLQEALEHGSKVLMGPRHRQTLGDRFNELARSGNVEVLEAWINPATGRPVAISSARLQQGVRDALPVEVTGDPIAYQVNRLPNGWIVELVNNDGAIEKPDQPAIIEAKGAKHVFAQAKFQFTSGPRGLWAGSPWGQPLETGEVGFLRGLAAEHAW
jgi:hypothetical protein